MKRWILSTAAFEPLFMKIRADQPDTKFAAPLYRSPICVATTGPQRGKIVSLMY